MVDSRRIRKIKEGKPVDGPVVYWMSREQRVNNNWALLHAIEVANKHHQPVLVVFNLVEEYGETTSRSFQFMLKGLQEVEKSLQQKNIPFHVTRGKTTGNLVGLLKHARVSTLVMDFDPLKIKRDWQEKVNRELDINISLVDARNIIPCWYVSDKQEFAAYTMRPKIKRKLAEFLVPIPGVQQQDITIVEKINLEQENNWQKILDYPVAKTGGNEINWISPGSDAGTDTFKFFMKEKLPFYASGKNDPNKDVLSNLSPYLHFGQLSAQWIALEVKQAAIQDDNTGSFLEELIIRRELSDNFCYYNENYDEFEGFPGWAKDTLKDHWNDKREKIYDFHEFEEAKTGDDLWNAAQMEMVKTGKMHGYTRMYWAKKILEWTENPSIALQYCIALNDKYELDGRDPNGYVGCAWSIGGVHDRAWGERPVFGKIRYMSYNGCKRKFDVKKYIEVWHR
jgi:deoxyribodipyrimidine photo-lyase